MIFPFQAGRFVLLFLSLHHLNSNKPVILSRSFCCLFLSGLVMQVEASRLTFRRVVAAVCLKISEEERCHVGLVKVHLFS